MKQEIVVVLGLFRGGTSCTAGVLHQLGVHMGDDLKRIDRYENYESIELRQLCVSCYSEPNLKVLLPYPERVELFRRWFKQRLKEKNRPLVIGAKHPLLCLLGYEITEATGGCCKFVKVQRPLDECLASIEHVRWWPNKALSMQKTLWQSREEFLKSHDYVEIDFNRLRTLPCETIRELIKNLGLKVNKRNLQKAVSLVNNPVPRKKSGKFDDKIYKNW